MDEASAGGLGYERDGARTRRIPRCPACWLHVASCVCAELPRLASATRVVLVMHHVELRRSSNTGRLAARVLGAEVRVRGLPGERCRVLNAGSATGEDGALPGEATGVDRGKARAGERGLAGRRLVLFPGANSRALTADDALGGPLTLVVPDGSWKQASRAAQRDEAAAGAEVVSLPPGPPGRYRLRRGPSEGALCTYEAIARALAILEGQGQGPAIEEAMMRALDLFVERTLALRSGP